MRVQFSLWEPDALPEIIKVQILSFFRTQWPQGFQEHNQFRDWIHATQDTPQHLVMHHNNTVIGHTSLLSRDFDSQICMGLSGFFIDPNFQNKGFGNKLLEKAYAIIDDVGVSFSAFHCDKTLQRFYEKQGWSANVKIKNLYGSPDNPKSGNDILIYKTFASAAPDLANMECFYFGEYLW